MTHTYVVSWDCHGLEACINISEIEKRKTWAVLKGNDITRDPDINQILTMLTLRARYNNQRHYEIYAIDTDDSVTDSDLKAMFDSDPQSSADLIRVRGRQLYSDRRREDNIKIR